MAQNLRRKLGKTIGAALRAAGNLYMLSPRCRPLLSGGCGWAMRSVEGPGRRGSRGLSAVRFTVYSKSGCLQTGHARDQQDRGCHGPA
jgi:hypothetical protein